MSQNPGVKLATAGEAPSSELSGELYITFTATDSTVLQDKTRQRGVTDAGTTVPLIPHLQFRNSDDNIYFIQLKTLIDLQFQLGSLSNQT